MLPWRAHRFRPGSSAAKTEASEILRIEADYFGRNAERMRYPRFRQ
jgi:hypothetical protein